MTVHCGSLKIFHKSWSFFLLFPITTTELGIVKIIVNLLIDAITRRSSDQRAGMVRRPGCIFTSCPLLTSHLAHLVAIFISAAKVHRSSVTQNHHHEP